MSDEGSAANRRGLRREKTYIDPSALAAVDANSVTEVASAEEKQALRLRDQGDVSMLSLENVQARYANRFEPEVLDAIAVWWEACLRSIPPMMWDGNVKRTWVLPERNYKAMLVKFCRVLLEPDEEWDEEEAQALAAASFAADSKGAVQFTRTHFADALFELADVWTETVEPAEYVAFLALAFEHIALDGLWREDEELYSMHTTAETARPSPADRARRSEGHRKRRSAVVIQSSSRRRQGQQHHQAQRRGAVKIQSHARRQSAQGGFRDKRNGAIRIQSHARRKPPHMGWKSRRLVIVSIQAFVRMRLCQLAYRGRRSLGAPIPGPGPSVRPPSVVPVVGLPEDSPIGPSHSMPQLRQPPRYMQPKPRPPTRLLDRRQAAERSKRTVKTSASAGALPLVRASQSRGGALPPLAAPQVQQTPGKGRSVTFSVNLDTPARAWRVAPPSGEEVLRSADKYLALLKESLPRPPTSGAKLIGDGGLRNVADPQGGFWPQPLRRPSVAADAAAAPGPGGEGTVAPALSPRGGGRARGGEGIAERALARTPIATPPTKARPRPPPKVSPKKIDDGWSKVDEVKERKKAEAEQSSIDSWIDEMVAAKRAAERERIRAEIFALPP